MNRLLLLLLLSSVLYFTFVENGQASQGMVEVTTNAARVVDDKNHLIALVYKGQQYALTEQINGCYMIAIENATACISTTQANVVHSVIPTYEIRRSTNSIYAKKRTPVYDEHGKLLAMLEKYRRHFVYKEDTENYYIIVGGRVGKVKKSLASKDKGIPVLMYHHLLPENENSLYRASTTISPTAFSRQMRLLIDNDIEVITTKELEQFLDGKRNVSQRAVVLTFDDGLKSNLVYAYPILQQYGFKATNFLITSRVLDKPKVFDPSGLQFISKKEMQITTDVFQYEGHTHQLHYVTDANISYMLTNTPDHVLADLQKSMNFMPQSYFAYPFGQYNEQIIALVKQVGYKMAFTTHDGYVRYGDDKMQLNRKGVYPQMTLQQFKNILIYE